jgi:hypothetical protein
MAKIPISTWHFHGDVDSYKFQVGYWLLKLLVYEACT